MILYSDFKALEHEHSSNFFVVFSAYRVQKSTMLNLSPTTDYALADTLLSHQSFRPLDIVFRLPSISLLLIQTLLLLF
jgi:hypothetical protein